MSKKVFLKGTLILACTGLISRLAGFFYRIFLSHTIGAAGMGLYQLVLPLQGTYVRPFLRRDQSAVSRLIASKLALCQKKEAHFSLLLGTCTAVFLSSVTGLFVFQKADFFASAILKAPKTAESSPPDKLHSSCLCSSFLHWQLLFCPEKSFCTRSYPAYRTGCPYRCSLCPVSDLSQGKPPCNCTYCCRRAPWPVKSQQPLLLSWQFPFISETILFPGRKPAP